MGDDLLVVDLGTGRTATAISAGAFHSCAILDTGTVRFPAGPASTGIWTKDPFSSQPGK